MKRGRVVALGVPSMVWVAFAVAAAEPPRAFEQDFVDATLRVDVYHVGNASEELVTLDRLHRVGTWAGSTTRLVDRLDLGRYKLSATDLETGRVLFTHGYDSYFGEYRTTGAAAEGLRRTYHESVLMPFPRRPVELRFEARSREGGAATIGTFRVDPDDPFIAREPVPGDIRVVEQRGSGDPHVRLDLAILGEGYTAADEATFRRDLDRFTTVLLSREPFATLAHLISVRGVFRPSREPGCDEPGRGTFRDTSVGASFDSLGSERYLLTEDNRALRDIAAAVPYDAMILMVNHDRYGGGGIYNQFSVFTAHNQWSEYLLVHELGHSFAGLADEYYTSSTAYNEFYPRGVEPLEPNITALLDPAALKWRELVAEDTPVPTPWEKEEFELIDRAYQKEREELNRRIDRASREGAPAEEVEALKAEAEARSRENAEQVSKILAASRAAGVVGAFEGAGYSATGLYRPEVDCIMFTKSPRPFCAVCQAAIAATIHWCAE